MGSAEGSSFELVAHQRIVATQPHPRRQRRRALAGIDLPSADIPPNTCVRRSLEVRSARLAGIDPDEAVGRDRHSQPVPQTGETGDGAVGAAITARTP